MFTPVPARLVSCDLQVHTSFKDGAVVLLNVGPGIHATKLQALKDIEQKVSLWVQYIDIVLVQKHHSAKHLLSGPIFTAFRELWFLRSHAHLKTTKGASHLPT